MMPVERQAPTAALKAAWLRQVAKAYDQLLWTYGLKVPPAHLELMSETGVWGRWRGEQRRLALSDELLWRHPWEAVMGILGHEIAHQLVWDLLPGHGLHEAPHGPEFHRMAAMINLSPFYQRAAVDLCASGPPTLPTSEKITDPAGCRILDRVRKLLALADSPVPAEAQAAVDAAARLMARHNLEQLHPGGSREYSRLALPLGRNRISGRLALIANILSGHFFVETIFTPAYDSRTDREVKNLELFGRPENVALAEHVFHFLLERSESLWRAYRRERGPGGGQVARNSYITGLFRGFKEGLEASAKMAREYPEEVSALVLADDKELTRFIRRHHPRLRTVHSRGSQFCPESENAGFAVGRSLKLARPLAETGPAVQGPGLLPGGSGQP